MQMGQPALPGIGKIFHDLTAEPGFLQQPQHQLHVENRFDGKYFLSMRTVMFIHDDLRVRS